MNTRTIVNSARNVAAKLKPAAAPATHASLTTTLASFMSLLPKALPIIARAVLRHPMQAAIAGAGILLLVTSQQRRRRYRYSAYLG